MRMPSSFQDNSSKFFTNPEGSPEGLSHLERLNITSFQLYFVGF